METELNTLKTTYHDLTDLITWLVDHGDWSKSDTILSADKLMRIRERVANTFRTLSKKHEHDTGVYFSLFL